MKVAVCTPTCGPPSWHFYDSMVNWQFYHFTNHPDVGVIHLRPQRSLPIDVARNLLVRQFLGTDADWMWFLDQDAAWKPGTLDRLMSWDRPIVSALEMMRMPDICYPMALKGESEQGYAVLAPEVYQFIGRYLDYESNQPQMLREPPDDSLLHVGFTGCHCLLIRRDVLEQMDEPWFQGYNPGGEDQYFCEKAAEMGVDTYVDMSVLVGHAATDRIIGAFDFMSGFRFLDELKRTQQRETGELEEWTDEAGS
jgi:predicted peroxiredoxin